jgi:hypothetical protein
MRRWRGLVLGAVLLTVLSGCSATPEVDPDAVQEWMATQDSTAVPGSLAGMTGLASALSDSVGEGGVTVSFAEPHPVSTVLFACFGPETMSADVTLARVDADDATTTQTIRTDDLICDGEPQGIEMTSDAATTVTTKGLSTDAVGAWSAVIMGEG